MNLEMKLPISNIILYGSYSRNLHTPASDIDIVVIYKGDERADAYNIVWEELALPGLEPKVYSVSQFNILGSLPQKRGIQISRPAR